MSSGPSSTSSNEATALDRPSELIALLDSDNSDTVEQTKSLIQENLYTSKDPSLLNALVDCFLDTRSTTALQILTNVHEARINHLFDKLNDCLKHGGLRRKVDTFSLLGHIIRKQPSWLYKIVKTSLFENVIKCLKIDFELQSEFGLFQAINQRLTSERTESDVLLLINGVLALTTLLPLIATYVEPWLHEFFEIYTRLAAFLNNRPGNIPDVYLLHLHVAVYYYFHRIYAMYPNNFVTFLRGFHHNSRSKQIFFQTTIKPMLEHVRLHPCLVTETTQSEIGKHRWRKKEPQDIVIECQSISLDPIDRVQTDSGLTTSWTSWHEALTLDKSVTSILTTSEDQFKDGYDIPRLKERRMSDSATQTGKSLQTGDCGNNKPLNLTLDDSATSWSPTEVCGLSTPPSEHMSPATSQPDLSIPQATLSVSQHCCTPVLLSTPGESPTSSLAGDLANNSPGVLRNKPKRGSIGKLSSTKSSESTSVVKPSFMDPNISTCKVDLKPNCSPKLSDNQTSTPKHEGKDHNLDGLSEKIAEDLKSDVSLPSEPVTPIDKLCNYDYGDKVQSVIAEEEQLTCGDHTMTTSENVAKEIKRILSGTKFVSLEGEEAVPDNPPPSLEVSLIGDGNLKPDNFESPEASGANLLKDKPVCNHLDKSIGSTSSNEGISFIAKTHNNQTEKISKSTHSQEIQTPNDLGSHTTHQERKQQKDSLNLFLSQNGHGQDQFDECGSSSFCKNYASSKPTPVEILDNYIQIGSSVHLSELTSLSLISSPETDWSHFGGDAPVDEIKILRGQTQLLHHQLLYERHKCEQHATRNRRLIGKTFKAVQYQEELLAIKDHLKLQEEKMRELTEALVKQTKDNFKFREITSAWDNQQQTQLRHLLNENAQLQHDKKTLKESLEHQKKQFSSLKMNLDEAQSKIFSLEQEREHLQPKLEEKELLKSELDRVTKELLVMGEINLHRKDLLEKAVHQKNPEGSLHLQSCQKELTASKQTARKQKSEIDALQSKIADLETTLAKRDFEIKELKKLSESSNGIFESKLKALEDKYDAQKKINQSIESHILNLQLALADSKHQNMLKTRTVSRSTSPMF